MDYGLNKVRDGDLGGWASHNQIGGPGMENGPSVILHGIADMANGVDSGRGVGQT